MIKDEIQGDIFEAVDKYQEESDKDIIFFHGCNAQGVMGSGVAKLVRERWPEAYKNYKIYCQISGIVGSIYPYKMKDVTVINAITQKGYGSPDEQHADLDLIENCLIKVDNIYKGLEEYAHFLSVRVGCGLGGLKWEDVREKYEQASVPWEIYYL